jgi:flagellar motor switch protein FliG
LRRARKNFTEQGLSEEAGICGLDIAAELLNEKRELEAQALFEEAAAELNPANERARAALAELASHFAAHDATPDAVRHVIEHLEAIKREQASASVAV